MGKRKERLGPQSADVPQRRGSGKGGRTKIGSGAHQLKVDLKEANSTIDELNKKLTALEEKQRELLADKRRLWAENCQLEAKILQIKGGYRIEWVASGESIKLVLKKISPKEGETSKGDST